MIRAAFMLALCCAQASAQRSVSHVDTGVLSETAVDQSGESFEVGGLSGVAYLGPGGLGHRFAAIMDNSDKLLFIEVSFGTAGSIEEIGSTQGLTLARRGDHEGIAASGAGLVLVADETSSVLREFSLSDGSHARTLSLPDVYDSRRNNLGLESLSFDPAFAWAANEEALSVDGPRASPTSGTLVRLLRERTSTDAALAQYAYRVEPMHGPVFPFGDPGQSGLCDLVALPDGSLLSLERSLAFSSPLFLSRIYEVGFVGATDVAGLASLEGGSFEPAGKVLLYEGGHANLEGLCLGPRLEGGGHALVGVVDDGDPVSGNTLVVFRLDGLRACPFDVNGDGVIDVGDLHALHRVPTDLNMDGVADAEDRRCLRSYLRRHERLHRRER